MKNSKYKSLFILVIILLMGLMGTGGYIVYEKIFKNENQNNHKLTGNISKHEKNNNKIEVANLLEHHYDDTFRFGFYPYRVVDAKINYDLLIPYLTGNSANIKTINKEIVDTMLYMNNKNMIAIAETANMPEESRAYNKGYNLTYDVKEQDGIIVIYLKQIIPEGGNANTTHQCGDYWGKSFYYDTNNDKMLNINEAARLLKLSLDNVYYFIGTPETPDGYKKIYIKDYDDISKSGFDFNIIIENNKFKFYLYDIVNGC